MNKEELHKNKKSELKVLWYEDYRGGVGENDQRGVKELKISNLIGS